MVSAGTITIPSLCWKLVFMYLMYYQALYFQICTNTRFLWSYTCFLGFLFIGVKKLIWHLLNSKYYLNSCVYLKLFCICWWKKSMDSPVGRVWWWKDFIPLFVPNVGCWMEHVDVLLRLPIFLYSLVCKPSDAVLMEMTFLLCI